MAQIVGSTVNILVSAPGQQSPAIADVPWYPGLTVLQAMIIGQAMTGPAAFSFRVKYDSEYGAYVDEIDGATEGSGNYWLLRLADPSGPLTAFGPAEQIIAEPPEGSTVTVYWTLGPYPAAGSDHLSNRVAATRG